MKLDYHMHFEYGSYYENWVKGFFDSDKNHGLTEIGISEHSHTFPEFKDTLRTLMTNQKQMTYLIKDIGLIEEIEAENQEDESMKEIKSYLLEPKLDISTKINLFMKEFIQSDNVLDKETIMHYITDPLEL